MRLSIKINQWLHRLMVRYVRCQYRKKIRSLLAKNPEIDVTQDITIQRAHLNLWNRLLPGCTTHWLDLFTYVSGKKDYRFIPEDVFYGVIERCLNNCNAAGFGVEDKNDVCFYLPKENQPKAYLRYVRGVYFNENFEPISRLKAEALLRDLRCDLVGKPTSESCGGANVKCFRYNSKESVYQADEIILSLDWIEARFDAYVLQERVLQETEVAKFNPMSLNTLRMMTFRRPWSGEVSVIATILRMGNSASIVDNLAAGGVSVDVDRCGNLADFAVDKYFRRVESHPTSNIKFKGRHVPYYDVLEKAVCDVAKSVPSHNLLSFDVVARQDGTPCIIEINATSMTLAQLQTCRPLFGDETEVVVDWCVKHSKDFDQFKHLRTFY